LEDADEKSLPAVDLRGSGITFDMGTFLAIKDCFMGR